MSFNSLLAKAYSPTVLALSGKTAGTVTTGPTLAMGGVVNVEWESLTANVSAALTTSTIVVSTRWEVSNDGVTWVPLYGMNGAANVQVAPSGTGTLATTAYAQACPVNPAYPYMRLSAINTVVTGGAGDNVTVSYNFKRRYVGGA